MELYRQVDDTGKVVLVNIYDLKKKKHPTKYEEKGQFPGQKIQYFMFVYDEAGNVTKSHSDRIVTKGERPGCIGNLKSVLVVTEETKEVQLTWDVTSDDMIKKFVIYRQKDDGPMLDYALIKPNQLYFNDSRIAIGSTYRYIVRPFSPDRVCPAVYSEPVYFEGNNNK